MSYFIKNAPDFIIWILKRNNPYLNPPDKCLKRNDWTIREVKDLFDYISNPYWNKKEIYLTPSKIKQIEKEQLLSYYGELSDADDF
jgi:hypothetical protein